MGSIAILVDEFDERELERAANLVDSMNHKNPNRENETLSQSLWSIVATIRHAREVQE